MLEMGLCELLPNHRINAERDHALHEVSCQSLRI